MILTKTHFLSPESTVAVQCEDGGPWTHSKVEETNNVSSTSIPVPYHKSDKHMEG